MSKYEVAGAAMVLSVQGEGSVCDLLTKQWFIAPKNNDLQCKR